MLKWHIELNKICNSSFLEPNPFRKLSSKGIALYGAGEMGKMAIDFLKKSNQIPSYIIDKNKSGYLGDIKIIKPEDVSDDDKRSLTFIVCIAKTAINPIYHSLKNLGYLDVRHFYDLSEILFPQEMSNGWIEKNINKKHLEYIFKLLEHDENSVAHYIQFLWWRLKRREMIDNNFPVLSNKKFFKAPCMPGMTKLERLIDGGSHHGQSIVSFLEKTNSIYDKIWAFEPDSNNLNILKKTIKLDINIYNKALSDKCEIVDFQEGLYFASKIIKSGNNKVDSITIDSLEINPSIIKLHIEGSEYRALIGANDTIHANRPIIMVLADHNKDGLYHIAKYLGELESYTLYFYLHDYCGNSAVYYAIPNERDSILNNQMETK